MAGYKLGLETPGHTRDGCDDCHQYDREYRRYWRQTYPEKYRAMVEKKRPAMNLGTARLRTEKREFVREVVGSSCVDCGEDRLSAIRYHHPHVRTTHESPSRLSWSALKDEVMHLIALCGTCHNLRHPLPV